jgi:hypothetical protein
VYLIPLRLLISPLAIAAINLLILVPMALSVADVAVTIRAHGDFKEPVEIVSTIAIIMIGWGVALEERHVLREMLGMVGRADEVWQEALDGLCHRVGVGVLVLGLFAEICAELVHLPDRIINTDGRELALLAVSIVLITIGGLIMARHVVRLLAAFKAG